MHNKLPLKYLYRVSSSKSFNLKAVDFNKLKENYPNAIITSMKLVIEDDENIKDAVPITIETDDGVITEVYNNGK